MVEKYELWRSFGSMGMPYYSYEAHFAQQRKIKVLSMCRPISAIRGMSPQEILELCGQENNIPVDIKAVLQKLHISCVPFDFSDLESKISECSNGNHILGALATNGDKAAIYCRVEDKEDSHRYRFTIAHELGHCCLNHFPVDGSTVHLIFRKDGETTDRKEIAANVFAGQLLIPEESLLNVISELLIPSIRTLADIFDVSSTVMLERLKFLKIRADIIGYNCEA